MKTMTHTEEQRKAWHKGKGSDFSDFIAACNSGNFRGAYTPASAKKGMFYKPLKPLRKGGGQ